MRQTSFEHFIRFGGSKSFALNLGHTAKRQEKQDNPAPEATGRDWMDQVWNKSFGATTQAIVKTPPYEFSPKGLADCKMSSSFSRSQFLRRQLRIKTDLLAILLMACAALASQAFAEPPTVRLGTYFLYHFQLHNSAFHTIGDLVRLQNADIPDFITGFEDCPAMVHGSIERGGTPRDSQRETWAVIQSLDAECWAMLQLDPAAPVTGTEPGDRVSPAMIRAVMDLAARLTANDPEWGKILLDFAGGEIFCKTPQRCVLSLPDGKNPPEQSLMMATGQTQFVEVTQMIHGRSQFVYAVRWHPTAKGGYVQDVFYRGLLRQPPLIWP